jgi:hypothetical protein
VGVEKRTVSEGVGEAEPGVGRYCRCSVSMDEKSEVGYGEKGLRGTDRNPRRW